MVGEYRIIRRELLGEILFSVQKKVDRLLLINRHLNIPALFKFLLNRPS